MQWTVIGERHREMEPNHKPLLLSSTFQPILFLSQSSCSVSRSEFATSSISVLSSPSTVPLLSSSTGLFPSLSVPTDISWSVMSTASPGQSKAKSQSCQEVSLIIQSQRESYQRLSLTGQPRFISSASSEEYLPSKIDHLNSTVFCRYHTFFSKQNKESSSK